MKLKSFLLLLFVGFQGISQISVASKHMGRSNKIEKEVIETFKNSETIFVLSNIYDKEVYEEILNDVWDVTPYKIIDIEDFDLKDYSTDDYSIAKLSGIRRERQMKSGGTSVSLFTYVDINMYDNEEIKEKREKYSAKKWERKRRDVLADNTINLARFYIFPNDDFISTGVHKSLTEIEKSLYTEDVFFNYKPGFLKNYFQKVNNLIKAEEGYWMYEFDYLPELKKLAQETLYIPAYMNIKYNPWTQKDGDGDDENIEDLFKKYEYSYQIISDEEMSDRIMNNESFYYTRYVRQNAERFLQVVNAKTGEIVFRLYVTGMSYKLKPKHIKELNKSIERAIKNKKP